MHIAVLASDFFRATTEGTRWHASVKPSLLTYNIMIGLFAGANEVHRAVGLLTEMERSGVAPDLASYNAIIRVLARQDTIAAEDYLVRMTNAQIYPDETTMDIFLLAYMRNQRAGTGISMVQSCFNQYGARPTTGTFRAVVDSLLLQEDSLEAERAAFVYQQLWPNETALVDELRSEGLNV